MKIKKTDKEKIKKMLIDGKSVKQISSSFFVSRQSIYNFIGKNNLQDFLKKKRKINKHVFSEWANMKFQEISLISKKYSKILSLEKVYIHESDISCVLLDLLIHTDQKNISNKEAYFKKYARLKVLNLKTKTIKRETKELIDEHGEEIYSCSCSPEEILIIKEKIKNKLSECHK